MTDPDPDPDPDPDSDSDSASDSATNGLTDLRQRIDDVDRRIVALIRERMDAVRDVRAHKTADPRAPFVDHDREKRVFARWSEHARALQLSPYHVGRILREVLAYSRRQQENLAGESGRARYFRRVGFQGVRACYADLALTKLLAARDGQPAQRIGYASLVGLFDALEQGGVDRIIVPVENSTSGAIVEVNELLASREIVVVDEEIYPVQHCLAGVPGARMAAITTVRSHPVALRQCERALGSLAGVRLEHADNTGRAAQSVGQNGDRSIAAICSPEAAAAYGLEILREDAADQVHNQTRFLLISKTPEPFDARQDAKTSLILSLDHRRGSLANCLQLFAQHNINLTRLESRPQPEQPWEYLFFVDFEGNPTEPNIHAALDAVRGHCNHMQTLGTYPLRAVERERVPAAATRLNPPALTTQPRGSGVVHVNGIDIGGGRFVIVASIPGDESSGTMLSLAEASLGRGASILHSHTKCPPDLTRRTTSARGPAVAPCEPITLAALADAGRQFEVPVSTFVTRPDEVGRIASSVDLLFVASDDLQDLSLLRALGRARRPVILTRSPLATIDTLLTAADYVCSEGNNQVLLCESGLRRTGGLTTRPTLDVSAIPRLKSETRYPVLVDPTRFSDDLETVIPLAIAAAAAGADGFVFPVLTAEVDRLSQLTHRLDATLSALGREL